VEGQLILGLLENDRTEDAVAAYLWFVNTKRPINQNSNQPIGARVARGKELTTSAYAAAALQFRKVSSQRLAGAVRSAEAQVKSLGEDVTKAKIVNSEHSKELGQFRKGWLRRRKRIEAIIVRRERNRRKQEENWIRMADQAVEHRLEQAEMRVEAFDKVNRMTQSDRQNEFDRLLDLFHSQLRLRAPVKLWEGRATQHASKARLAMGAFVSFTLLAIAAGALIPYYFGDYIAESFFTQVCQTDVPTNCTRAFSAKGPLTISGILVIMSLVMWAIRLQYRVYLSERHLALDASEKQAFAETFLAMKEGEDVGSENEAIVLASLFRPTQDGIIKDDESGLDFSTAAILAKQIGRGPT